MSKKDLAVTSASHSYFWPLVIERHTVYFTVGPWNRFTVALSFNENINFRTTYDDTEHAGLTLRCSDVQGCARVVVFQIHVHGGESKPEGEK